jgi:hypothetical protein
MSWEIIGAVAGGLADAKRQRDQKKELDDYRKSVKGYYDEQAEEIRESRRNRRRGQSAPNVATQAGEAMGPPESAAMPRNDIDYRADGGLIGKVGGEDGLVEHKDWYCGGMSSDLWQKQSFKK